MSADSFEAGYDEGYSRGLEVASTMPEYWEIYQKDMQPIHIGDLIRYPEWSPFRQMRVLALGEDCLYVQFEDGDVIGYAPDDVEWCGR